MVGRDVVRSRPGPQDKYDITSKKAGQTPTLGQRVKTLFPYEPAIFKAAKVSTLRRKNWSQ